MGYNIINISELNTFDFSQCTKDGVQICTIDNVRKSANGSFFLIEGDSITNYSSEEIKTILNSVEWNDLAFNLRITEININYLNNTSTATIKSVNQPIVETKSVDFINEFNTYKTTFEYELGIEITSVNVDLNGVQTMLFNDSISIECSSLNLTLFNELSQVFNIIKQNIIDQLCA